MTKRTCSVDGCDRPNHARGYCAGHYKRWRNGRAMDSPITQYYQTPEASFEARTARVGECLIWTGGVNRNGYGLIKTQNGSTLAHRFAWESSKGLIPDGMALDHICGNPPCCDVKHLRVVSTKQNLENRVKLPANNTSGYRGVYWHKQVGKWFAKVKHEGREYRQGWFDTPEEANKVAIELRNQLFTHNNRDRAA